MRTQTGVVSFMSEPLTPDQKEALNQFIDAVAAIRSLPIEDVQAISEHVTDNGTDHEDGTDMDLSVGDALDVIIDQM